MPLDLKPHKYQMDPKTGMATLNKVMPYKLYVRREPGGNVEIYLQNGTYYYLSGEKVPREKLLEVGLDPEFGADGQTVPESMTEHPAMQVIIEAEQTESIRSNARPIRTVVVSNKE